VDTATSHLEQLARRHPALASLRGVLSEAVAAICRSVRQGGKLLVCGNGGSAADAEHIVGELMKSFVLDRKLSATEQTRMAESMPDDNGRWVLSQLQRGVPAIALGAHSALLTAICNDTDARMIFAQPVYVLGRPGDVLLALSTSGNSPNIVAALQVARARGLVTIGFTGERPAAMDAWCDVLLKVPAVGAWTVQEYHLPLYHALCLIVENELFGATAT